MSKNKFTILVDQDGVLANYDKRILEIVAAEYPNERQYLEDELVLFDTHHLYSGHVQQEIDDISLRSGFFESLEPVEGAVEAMRDLLSSGFDVRICTAPKKKFKYCVTEKLSWIEKHLGKEFVVRTILTRDKTLVRGNILIDDKPEVVGGTTPEWEHILYDRPYNRHVSGKRRLNWQNYREVLGIN